MFPVSVTIHESKLRNLFQMIPVTSFGLGCWQVHRLQWKLELIDMMQAKTNATSADMPRESVSINMNLLLQLYIHCSSSDTMTQK